MEAENGHRSKTSLQSKPFALEKKKTLSIEELFGDEDTDDENDNDARPVRVEKRKSLHDISDSDDGDDEPGSMKTAISPAPSQHDRKLDVTNQKPSSTYKQIQQRESLKDENKPQSRKENSIKRKHSSEGSEQSKPACPYGLKCYRKNPTHFKEMNHPGNHPLNSSDSGRDQNASKLKRKRTSYTPDEQPSHRSSSVTMARAESPAMVSKVMPKNKNSLAKKPSVEEVKASTSKMSESKNTSSRERTESKNVLPSKLSESKSTAPAAQFRRKDPSEVYQESLPLSFLLTKVKGIEARHNHSLAMHIKEILSTDMGKIQQSAQFNYKIDIPWLVQQYPPDVRTKPLLVVHGAQREEKRDLESEVVAFSHIRLCQARLEILFGTHHTKMMLLLYDTGLRIVIHTANLIHQDWFQKTQGIWISPVFPPLGKESATEGDSDTRFKLDMLEYLAAYRAPKLNDWMKIIREHDLSSAKVYIIGSVPGRHAADQKSRFGHLKLKKVLEKNGPDPDLMSDWPVIGQFSSIGSLGKDKETWLCSEWLASISATRRTSALGRATKARLNLIFPSKENVRNSLEGYAAGGSIPYSINVAKKQTYVHEFFHQWRSEVRGRTPAMPHIKTYTRVSPNAQQLAWFLVTSSNMSKAAWGGLEKNGSQLMIRSYELGVLFLPQQFKAGTNVFKVMQDDLDLSPDQSEDSLVFPVPYDLPLTDYYKQDKPWVWDIPYVDKPDTHGTKWCPPLK